MGQEQQDRIRAAVALVYEAEATVNPMPENWAARFIRTLGGTGFEIVPKSEIGSDYVLTPEGEDIIRDLVEHTALTQADVTAAGDALERDFDAAPSRFLRHVSGRDHAVAANALAVRDLIEANALIAGAVAVLGHEAADTILRNLITPDLGAAAA